MIGDRWYDIVGGKAHGMRTTLAPTDLAEVDRVFASVSKPGALGELASLRIN